MWNNQHVRGVGNGVRKEENRWWWSGTQWVQKEGSYSGGIHSHLDVPCGQSNSHQLPQILFRVAPHVSGVWLPLWKRLMTWHGFHNPTWVQFKIIIKKKKNKRSDVLICLINFECRKAKLSSPHGSLSGNSFLVLLQNTSARGWKTALG